MKNKPVYHYAPAWMIEELKGRQCDKCSQSITKENIIAIGIRDNNANKTIYMEHQCPKCKYREMTNCGGDKRGTLEELCYALLEELQLRKRAEKAKLARKNARINKQGMSKPWTNKEVEEFKKFIGKCDSHDQFLEYIRAPRCKKDGKNEEKPSAED